MPPPTTLCCLTGWALDSRGLHPTDVAIDVCDILGVGSHTPRRLLLVASGPRHGDLSLDALGPRACRRFYGGGAVFARGRLASRSSRHQDRGFDPSDFGLSAGKSSCGAFCVLYCALLFVSCPFIRSRRFCLLWCLGVRGVLASAAMALGRIITCNANLALLVWCPSACLPLRFHDSTELRSFRSSS